MRRRKIRPAALAFSLFRHVVLMAGTVIMIAPFVMMVSISLKPAGEVFAPGFALWPQTFAAVENYTAAFMKQPLGRYLLNGLLVGLCIFAAQAALAVPCAYALAKLRWRGRDTTFALVLLANLILPQVTAIPLYIGMWQLGLLDTYAAIILPSIISVFGIFLMRQFFLTVPDDMIHAARIDGLGEFDIVWRIVVPTAIPALVSFGILSFVWNWNELFWPLIAVQSPQLATPPLGVVFFANAEAGTNFNLLMAAAVVINLPLVIAFLIAQRWFIAGVTMTGVK
jgi:multiple sugar transport system permease protein